MDWQSWGLLLSAYTSATLLPGSSELALGAVLLQAPQQWLWWLGVATVGNVLGSMTSWGMGYWLARYRLGLWPLGYWLAAQGVIMLYVLIAAGYAWLANRHERLQDSRRGRGHEL